MIIDTGMTIAYKCSSCGTYEFFNASLFRLTRKKNYCLTCRCKRSGIAISEKGYLKLSVRMHCIACGNEHVFDIDAKEFINKGIGVFYCPRTGIQLCFVGNDILVRQKIDTLEKELDEMIDTFGYESYFKNTRVMFDSLNRIHDIAEQGNLVCECGCSDIELILLSDRIQLKCSKCPGINVIHAASNEDLKDILKVQQIFLSRLQNTI
ncbi:MAG: hypothetical protein N2484_08060 [Clostridia bacterium]|nr:hypothetical protein [Clostridia bacterium]